MNKLLRHLKKDKKDEEEGEETYSKRAKQHPRLSKMYLEMMEDEEKHGEMLEEKMPIAEYYKGSGEKVMASMKKKYGEKKGKSVFYATAKKKDMERPGKGKGKKKANVGPSDKVMRKHGMN